MIIITISIIIVRTSQAGLANVERACGGGSVATCYYVRWLYTIIIIIIIYIIIWLLWW